MVQINPYLSKYAANNLNAYTLLVHYPEGWRNFTNVWKDSNATWGRTFAYLGAGIGMLLPIIGTITYLALRVFCSKKKVRPDVKKVRPDVKFDNVESKKISGGYLASRRDKILPEVELCKNDANYLFANLFILNSELGLVVQRLKGWSATGKTVSEEGKKVIKEIVDAVIGLTVHMKGKRVEADEKGHLANHMEYLGDLLSLDLAALKEAYRQAHGIVHVETPANDQGGSSQSQASQPSRISRLWSSFRIPLPG